MTTYGQNLIGKGKPRFAAALLRGGLVGGLAGLLLAASALPAPVSAQGPNVSPDGGSLQAPANRTGLTATFTIWQWSGSSVSYMLICSRSGAIASCSANYSVTVPCCGQPATTTVWFSTGNPGTGTLTLTARHVASGMIDQGSYNATVIAYGVAVTPDGANEPPRASNTAGHTAPFTIRNTGATQNTYALSCAATGPVACTSLSATSVTLGAGLQSNVTATYSVGAPGNGTLTLNASGTFATDAGSYTVPVVEGVAPFAPSSIVNGEFRKDARYLLQETAHDYDAFGRVEELGDARDKRTTYEYGGNANVAFLTKVTRLKDASGSINLVTDLAYDGSGFLQSIRDEGGSFRYFTYDSFGRLRQIKNHNAEPVKAFGYVYSRTSPNWAFNLASPNAVVDTTFVQHAPVPARLVSTSYMDGLGRPIQTVVQDGAGFVVTASAYDAMGRPWRSWKPYARASAGFDPSFAPNAKAFYEQHDQLADAKPFVETFYRNDALGRVREVIPEFTGLQPNGSTVHTYGIVASESKSIVQVADESDKKTQRFADAFGNTVKTVLGAGTLDVTTLFEFDILGQLVKSTDPRALHTTYVRDTRGLLTARTSPDAGTVQHKYDKAGNLRYSQDANQAALGKVVFANYDFANRALKSGLGAAVFSSLDPDAATPPALETPEANWLLVRAYDTKPSTDVPPWNLFSSEITPLVLANVSGRLAAVASKSNGAWQATLFSYDVDGRVQKRHTFTQANDGGSVLAALNTQVEYVRDLREALTERRLTVGPNAFNHWYEYDNRGLLWKVFASTGAAKPATPDATFTYRPSGQVQSREFQGGPLMQMRYTIREELEKMGDPALMTPPFAGRYAYHANGTVKEAEFYSHGSPAPAKRYKYEFINTAYDALNRLKSADFWSWNGAWTSTPAHDLAGIGYDASGNLTALQRYRETGTLVDNLTYFYPGGSNRLSSVSDAVGATGEPWDAESGSFTYDANGNVLTAPAPYAISAVTYNHQNLPLSLTSNGVASSYRYDGSGQRIAKHVSGQNPEIYVLDGATTLGVVKLNGSGAPDSWHFNVLAGDRVIGRQPSAGNRKYYHTDLLGSTRAVVEGGTVVESYDPEPWGFLMSGRTLGSGTKEGFTGKERDAESGLDYFGARLYMPALARWTSVDPLAEKHPEWSPYSYVLNNPVALLDPDGRQLSAQDARQIFADVDRGTRGLTRIVEWIGEMIGMKDAVEGAEQAGRGIQQGELGTVIVGVGRVATSVPSPGRGVVKTADKAIDAADDVGDALRAGGKLGNDAAAAGAGGVDFIVTGKGTAVPVSQSRMREGFDAAGFPSRPTKSPGVEHDLPDGMHVRTMEPTANAPRRASFENANGQPVTPDGAVPQPPRGSTPTERRQYVRERTHVPQTP